MKKIVPIILVSFAVVSMANALPKNDITVGKTYDIAEPDSLEQVETRANQINWNSIVSNIDPFKSVKRVSLPKAPKNRTRYYIPWYETEFDVKDKNGNVVYPAGFKFNPLEYIHLQQRLVVATESQMVAMKDKIRPTDKLILTDGDILNSADSMGRHVFILDEAVKTRLDIQFAPSIISQEGPTLRIEEFAEESLKPVELPKQAKK